VYELHEGLRYTPRVSISAFGDKVPAFSPTAYVHPDATIIGSVVLRAGANVWPGAVLRADTDVIELAEDVSFQDNAVAHTDEGFPLFIGRDSLVGHAAVVHGATIGEGCLIGMGSVLLNGCEIGDESIVGANSLVTQGRRFPPRSLILGSPARLVRELTDDDLVPREELTGRYSRRAARYAELGMAADLSAFLR
jgi:carbonic anhydrase/acetyltransferase-like protein (isoleucine patch superfamily)